MHCRILVIGDSSSSAIGAHGVCYPTQLYYILKEQIDIELHNCAVPGMTSADVTVLCHSRFLKQQYDYVIIYLGNNEGAYSKRKGTHSQLSAFLKYYLSMRSKTLFSPILSSKLSESFRYAGNTIPDVATHPDEFERNLHIIVNHLSSNSTDVVLINPIANDYFPSGIGEINSSYFLRIGPLGNSTFKMNNIAIDANTLQLDLGLRLFANKKENDALRVWESIDTRNHLVSFIANHNISCAIAEHQPDKGFSYLESLVSCFPRYDSIILHNIGQLHLMHGNSAGFEHYSRKAAECDKSLYRIKESYRKTVSSFSNMAGVQVLDLAKILHADDFIDYCHPTESGHLKIAGELTKVIAQNYGIYDNNGFHKLKKSLPTPDFSNRPGETLIDYYCIDWPITPSDIQQRLAANSPNMPEQKNDVLDEPIQNFFKVNGGHPIFTDNIQLTGRWMPLSHEILSFPEFYLYRIIYNYFTHFEKIRDGCAVDNYLMFSPEDYKAIILAKNKFDLEINLDTRVEYYTEIKKKITASVEKERLFRNLIGCRVHTTMKWYTREAFRYGTHSRTSMLYPRWAIDQLLEAAVVSFVILHFNNMKREKAKIIEFMKHITELMRVHEKYCSKFSYHSIEQTIGYDEALRAARSKINCSSFIRNT